MGRYFKIVELIEREYLVTFIKLMRTGRLGRKTGLTNSQTRENGWWSV